MVYEYRRYVAQSGKLAALHDRLQNEMPALFQRHGMDVVGYWEPVVGTLGDEIHYLLRWSSMDECGRNWSALLSDEDWHRVKRESEADGPLLACVETQFWKTTSYSPIV